MLVTKGSSLRRLKNEAYPSIWKEKTKPSRLVRCRREATKGKHDSYFIFELFSSPHRSISETRSELINSCAYLDKLNRSLKNCSLRKIKQPRKHQRRFARSRKCWNFIWTSTSCRGKVWLHSLRVRLYREDLFIYLFLELHFQPHPNKQSKVHFRCQSF